MNKFRFILAAVLALPCAEGLAADHNVSDAAALAAVFAVANGGDTVFVSPGNYGEFSVASRHFSPAVNITAADVQAPPVFSSISLRDVSGLDLTAIAVEFGQTSAPLTTHAVAIDRGADILIRKAEIQSSTNNIAGDDAYGVYIRNSVNVTIKDSVIHDVYRGVAVLESNDVAVAGNSITRVGSDGVVAGGVLRLTIENNYFADFDIIDPVLHHPDAIQIWSQNASRANSEVVIRGNLIRRGSGDPSQGVFVNTSEIETTTLLIEENVIEHSMGQGLFVSNASDVVIRNNTLLPVDYRLDAPGLEIRAPSQNISVSDNIASAFRLDFGVKSTGNISADYQNPWIADFVGNLIANPEQLAAPDDYAALTGVGARRFVRHVWAGDANVPLRSLAPASLVADISFHGNVVDQAPDPLSISEVKEGSARGYFQSDPAPKLSAALNLTVEASVSFQADGEWQLIAAVPNVFDLRVLDDRIRFSLWTEGGAATRIDARSSALLDRKPHSVVAAFDGVAGAVALYIDGEELGRGPAPSGPVNYLPTQRLYAGGAPWGLAFGGQIGALNIRR